MTTGVSGVRSSWLKTARKWSLARLAWSAASFAHSAEIFAAIRASLARLRYACSSASRKARRGRHESLDPLLEHVVAGAQFEHLDGCFLDDRAGEKDERHFRAHLPCQPQSLQYIHAGNRVVGKDQSIAAPPQGFCKPGVRIHAVDLGIQAVFAQERQRQVGGKRVVFQIQDPQCWFHRFNSICLACGARPNSFAAIYRQAWRRLVNDTPEQAQFFHRLHKGKKIDRLDDVGVRPQPVALQQVSLLTRRGEDHDRQESQARIGPDLPQDFDTVHLGHLNVQQDDGGGAFARVAYSPRWNR